ncbi:hypothetical protein FHG87_024605, partial [Trinorchestia longiramus]
MASYAKYSLVPTDEPDKTGIQQPDTARSGGGSAATTSGIFGNLFTNTHKAPSMNRSTLPPPPNSAFDYTSAFNFKSAFEYNSSSPSQYQSAFDYGYRKDPAAATAAAANKK